MKSVVVKRESVSTVTIKGILYHADPNLLDAMILTVDKAVRLTAELVEPTWPVVQFGNDGYLRCCGKCGLGISQKDGIGGECPHCGSTLRGEVPQSRVAEFLKQESE